MKNTLAAVILLAGMFSAPARADVPKDTAWETYISASKKLHVAFHDLNRTYHPDLTDVIEKSLELELAVLDERSARFYFLLERYPERIVRTNGFSAFIDSPWTGADEAELRETSSKFRKLQKRIGKLQNELAADPLYEESKNTLKRLESDPRYIEIAARHRFLSKEIEEILAPSGQIEIK